MSAELAYLVAQARQQTWSAPAGSSLLYAKERMGATPQTVAAAAGSAGKSTRPPQVLGTYLGSTIAIDTSAQADFSDHEYQKNWQAREYERGSIEDINNEQAQQAALRFVQRLAVGPKPRVAQLHQRIIAGRSMERTQYIMHDEPTLYTHDGTDPTIAMWNAAQASRVAWESPLPFRDAYRPVQENERNARGPWW